MIFQAPSILSTVGFLMIIVWVIFIFLWGVHRVARSLFWKVGVGFFVWLGLISCVVISGKIEELPFPRLMILFVFVNLCCLGFGLSPLGRKLAHGISIQTLIGFQIFRLPLEIVLHSWVDQGVIPMTMTWNGSNWDVVSGVMATAAFLLWRKIPSLIWIANGVGFVLLLNVMRVAVMSSPLPFAWDVQPPLQLAFHLPYVWIVPVCVGGALAGHVILTRALVLSKKSSG